MIDFYYNLGPNPMKVALFLEEAGLDYRPIPVDMLRGDQFDADFTRLNPNNKAPVIVDGGRVVFDSNAILLYLGEQHGRFLGKPERRGELLSWLMFVASGIGPYSGQAVHFRHYAPEPKQYGVDRYLFEARRHFEIVDQRLATQQWIVDGDYTIVDMALWGWARNIAHVIGADEAARLPHLAAFLDRVAARRAAARVEALRQSHDFTGVMDEDAKRRLFGHLPRA
jgi:GST-like protein